MMEIFKLLHFEFRKLFRRKSFYICLAVQAGYLLLTAILQLLLYKAWGDDGEEILGAFSQGYTGVDFMLRAAGEGATSLILAVFVTLFSCEDRTSDVLKNVYARGYNSTQVYFAEFIALSAYAAIYCVFSWVVGFLLGTAMFGVGSGFDGLSVFMLFVQILAAIAFTALFHMFAKVIPKQGGAVAMNIFAPVILSLIFSVIDVIIIVSAAESLAEPVTISKYSITGLFGGVSETGTKAKDIAIEMALAVAYAAVFLGLGALANRKKQA